MRARLFWPIVICFALTACAIQRTQIANDARIDMLGLSKEQVLACMGPPLNQNTKGTAEVWSYNSENHVTPAGDGNEHCTVNLKMWNGRVGAVDYLGPAGGVITFNQACASAVEKCVAKP
jgi:outer membrane protein assembly factor BamE (lipoprotein component of BamABCDE complex)